MARVGWTKHPWRAAKNGSPRFDRTWADGAVDGICHGKEGTKWTQSKWWGRKELMEKEARHGAHSTTYKGYSRELRFYSGRSSFESLAVAVSASHWRQQVCLLPNVKISTICGAWKFTMPRLWVDFCLFLLFGLKELLKPSLSISGKFSTTVPSYIVSASFFYPCKSWIKQRPDLLLHSQSLLCVFRQG